MSSLKWWDEENELVKSGYVGPKGETDFAINDELRKAKDQMDMVFKYFEINEKIPTPSEVTKMYKERMSGIMPKRPEPEPKKREQKPNMKMGEISSCCGFSSPSVFSRTFTAMAGLSPREWSKK